MQGGKNINKAKLKEENMVRRGTQMAGREDGESGMGWKMMCWMSSSSSISRSLVVGECNNENSCSGCAHRYTHTHTQSKKHSSSHLATHSSSAIPHKHIFTHRQICTRHHSYPHTRRLAAQWYKWGPAKRSSYPELSAGGGWHH